MQTFSALLGSNATGASSPRTSTTSGTQDERQDPGGFDRLMQTQSRDEARAGTQPSSRTQERAPERMQERERSAEADSARRTEGKRDDADRKTQQARSEHDSRRTEAKDDDSPRRDTDVDDTAKTADSPPAEATAGAAAATTASDVAPASPASLPEQLLALLNGLAAAPATTAPAMTGTATADVAANARVADAPVPTSPGATRPLLSLQPTATPTAMPADAMPAANDAGASGAFALAMGAATDPDKVDTSADTTATGDVAAPPLSVANATVHPLSRAAAAAVQANQPLSVDSGFEDGFGSRIAWLADQKVGHAEIRVSPDHLGTIDVRLQLDGNRVNAEFHSTHADVRQALESSLPRLREMLGQQGLQLGQADVGQRQPQQQAPNGHGGFAGPADAGGSTADGGWTPGPAVRASRGLLDEYA